jgi:hypothetical protein
MKSEGSEETLSSDFGSPVVSLDPADEYLGPGYMLKLVID